MRALPGFAAPTCTSPIEKCRKSFYDTLHFFMTTPAEEHLSILKITEPVNVKNRSI